uniref:Uncharacterized protein n=1 Tax=Sphaerodactylus townsendi TaxID=933632 RepID=A0ACB8ECN5_9SAUR
MVQGESPNEVHSTVDTLKARRTTGLCVAFPYRIPTTPIHPQTKPKQTLMHSDEVESEFVAQLLGFLISVVSSIFCGHLEKAELDSVTYGRRNVKRVGTILQWGVLILLLFCFPCWAFFVNTEQVLLLFGQGPEVSRLTQVYVMIFIPALPTYGRRNVKCVGTILQRGILILLLFCFPCWAFFINTEQVLLLFGQDPEVSRLTQVYVMIFIPALPGAS